MNLTKNSDAKGKNVNHISNGWFDAESVLSTGISRQHEMRLMDVNMAMNPFGTRVNIKIMDFHSIKTTERELLLTEGIIPPVVNDDLIDFWCLTPFSAIFQLYHGDQI